MVENNNTLTVEIGDDIKKNFFLVELAQTLLETTCTSIAL